MQDIISSEKRSIRNISIDRTGQAGPLLKEEESTSNTPPREPSAYSPLPPRPFGNKNRRLKTMYMWIGGVIVLLLILFIVISSFFSGATVLITPRHAEVSIDATATAYANPAPGELGYMTVTLSREGVREVLAVGEESVETPASGIIVVYNNHDENPQRLIPNTRFQTPEGLVYRIHEAITVPGRRQNAQGETTPGSVEVQVFADGPGEQYNIGLSDFTIPGFKESNDPRFETFYARSKTPMTGGFEGVVQIASKDNTETAQEEIKTELTDSLMSEAQNSAPEGFILISDTPHITFEKLPNGKGSTADTVSIRMKGTLSAVAINAGTLASYAAAALVPEYSGAEVRFADVSTIQINPVETSTTTRSEATDSIDVSVVGMPTIVWVYNIEELQADLAGKTRRVTDTVFSRYDAIEKAEITLTPFWKRTLPKDPAEIEIREEPITE